MKITKAIRKEIEPFLPTEYRKQVVARLAKKDIKIHPNTVKNVFRNGNDNTVVAAEIIALALEEKKRVLTSIETMRQLSAA